MVHETGIILATGEGCDGKEHVFSYLRIELVDLLDRTLDVTRMDCSPDLHSRLDRLGIRFRLDVGFDCKFLRSCRIAIGD